MKLSALTMALGLTAVALTLTAGPDHAAGPVKSPLEFTVKNIEGKDTPLSKYKGKVTLIVNTASQCGLTPQYAGLETLYGKYKAKGLRIIGFPANNFGSQEPGTDKEIQEFCTGKYKVTFDMFSKISVAPGKEQAPLYKFLTETETNPKFAGPIKWNFTKFLVNEKGEVIARFEPGQEPLSPEVIKAVEAALHIAPTETK